MKPCIILDLGGVVLPLHTEATRQKILQHTKKDIKEWMKFGYPHSIIQKFELGKITEKEFFDELRDALDYEGDLYYLKEAWNAMLLPVPEDHIRYLRELSHQYKIILLSNTCDTHIQCFECMLQQYHQIENFESIFDRVYYSCRIGLRKPDSKIFQKVIKENNLCASQTYYFDDTYTHIEAAQSFGIQTVLYPQNAPLRIILEKILHPQSYFIIKAQ